MAGKAVGISGRECVQVEATAKDPEREVYGRVVHCIDTETSLPVRRKYFDRKGEAIKEWRAHKIEKIDGQWVVLDHRMQELPDVVESRIVISDIDFDAEIPDEVFSLDYLAR